MAVPPSDKVPAAKLYRTQYLRQSVSNCTGYSIRSKKTTDGIIYYIHYLYFRAQNNGSWYSPLEFNFDHDVPFYLDASGSSGVTNLYVFVDGQQYTFNNASGYQVQCAMASYTTYTDATWPFTTSTIAPLYDPAYADTEVSPIIINKLTRSQYESVAPNETELYLVTDANLETTDHKVQTIDANSTDTQYPSATAVNNVKYQNEPFWIQPTENAYVGLVGMTMGPSATRNISYSFDGIEWIDTTVKGLIEGYRYVLQGEKIYFKSSSTGRYWSTQFVVKDSNSSSGNNVDFTVGGKLISLFNGIPGDATSLLSETNVTDASKLDINSETTCCTCTSLFVDCVVLNTPPVLPATLLPDSAYKAMFYGCISLINAPALPAETLTDFCYMSMFANCTSLRYAPPIKAKTLAEACCQEMFLGCTSLETVPELLATTMVQDCYYSMFSGCTSLKQIPKLYATTLAEECYQEMFNGCTSLELQTASDGTHYNIVKIPEKPKYDWTLTWNNSMITAPNGSAIFNDTLITGTESPVFPTPLYALPSTTTFNGSSTYIDTGVQLLSTDQDFTIFVDFQYNSQTSMMTVFHCINEASPYPGILLDVNNSYFRAVYYGEKNIAAYDTSRHKIIFTHSAGTTTSCLIYFDSTTGMTNTVDRAYSNVSQNVLLGCYQDTSGNKGRWFNGTIYDARIYNTVLSSTQIGYLMSSGEWTVRGATLTGLTFSSNGLNYDGISVDRAGNMYYGQEDSYAEVYYASTGWVNNSYKTLSISNDPADFEDKFINSGTPINLYDPTTITTGYYINSSGVQTTGAAASISDYIPVTPGHNYTWTGVAMQSGTNNKRVAGYATTSTTTGTVINNVAITGTNVPYENTFTVPNGLNYVRLSFNTVDTDIVLVDNDAAGENAWGTFKDTNLTISYAWDARGLALTGMNFKSNNTDYIALLVDNEGNISYGIKPYYIYARSGGNYLKDMPIFKDVFKVVIYSQNHEGSILYTWTGEPSEVQGNDWNGQNNHLLVNGVSVWGRYAGIIGWDIYSWNSNSSNGSGYNTQTTQYTVSDVYTSANGWTNSNYKTLTSSYNLSQHFTGTNWSSFFATNKNTNTSSTITVPSGALTSMFSNTGGTWTGTPVLNKAYFTNAVLIPEANMSQTDTGYAEIWWKDALVTSGQSLYSLLTTTTFNGTSDYIDTNIKVLNGDPTFSIFVDFQQAALASDMREVIHCNTEVNPYPGLSLDYNTVTLGIRLAYYNKVNAYTRDTNRHKAIFTHNAGDKNVCTCYYDSTTAVPTTGTTAYSNVDRNLLIGCYQDANGNKGRFLNGTIYSCIVLDRIFTSAEISSLMSGNIPSTINWSVKNQILSVRFICNGILYDKLRIDSDGSMYYGQGNVYTIVYNVNTNTWDDGAKKIQVLSSISSTFINEWNAFLSRSKLY